jgi:hypothetical protein
LNQYGLTLDSLATILQKAKGETGPTTSIPSTGLPTAPVIPTTELSGLFPLLLQAYSQQAAINAAANCHGAQPFTDS